MLANPRIQREINRKLDLPSQDLFCHIEEESLITGLSIASVSYEVFQRFLEIYHVLKDPKQIEKSGLAHQRMLDIEKQVQKR